MKKNILKLFLPLLLSMLLLVSVVEVIPAAQNIEAATDVNTQYYANIVVFVDFADTTHNHEETYFGQCYKKDPRISDLFEGDESHTRALNQYISNISYGQLKVKNIIPQYNSQTNTIEPYVLSQNVDYYGDRNVGDIRLIQEISALLMEDDRLSKNDIVDYNGDGCVDNLMIIGACEKGNSNSQIYGHKSTYDGTEEINSKKIGSYTVIPEGSAYFGLSESGVVIHEFLHSLGYPDLYVNTNVQGVVPVGQWDIMATESKYLQYPLAYFRSAYSGWFNIPAVTESKKNYSIYAASATTYDTKDSQAVILKTDYSTSEFFVVEYRKQGDKYDEKSYDNKIYGSGLIIYRVSASLNGGNMYGPPYKIYVFRPGDVIYNGYEKADYTGLPDSFLSKECGRTSYGTHDMTAGIEQNAITYSDGTNSGIVIENVGSTKDDKITFDISFADDGNESKWITESTDNTGFMINNTAACSDKDGNQYFICNTGNSYSGETVVLQYSKGIWSRVTDGPAATGNSIVSYNGDIYVSYVDKDYHVRVDKWDGSRWQNIHKSDICSNEISLSSGEKGVYFTYADTDGNSVFAYKYDGKVVMSLSDKVCYSVGKYPSNPIITADDSDNIFVAYREAFNDNRIYINKYDSENNSWSVVSDGIIKANNVQIANNSGRLYLLKNGTSPFDASGSTLYSLDYLKGETVLKQVGDNNITDMSVNYSPICFSGDDVFVGSSTDDNLTFVSGLIDNQWQQLGNRVSIQSIDGFNISYNDSKIYASYLDKDMGRIIIRSYPYTSDIPDVPDIPDIPITEISLNSSNVTITEGDSIKLIAQIIPDNTTNKKTVIWSSNDSSVAAVDADGNVTAKKAGKAVITAMTENGKTAQCAVTVQSKEMFTGLVQIKDKLYYYKDNVFDSSYTGFIDYSGSRVYVQDGCVTNEYTNVIQDENDWVFVKNSRVEYEYTGLVKNEYGWWRIENGKVDFEYTGLAENEYGWWRIENGKVDFEYTGLAENEYGWWRVENGKVDFGYTGLAENEYGWWRVENGKVNFEYTGIASNEYGTFYVENGRVDFSKNGSCIYNGVNYYIQDGCVYVS